MIMEVIKTSMQTTIQDLGRTGFRHLGVNLSGALDKPALKLANHLVGNSENAAGLEINLGQSVFVFKRDAWIALTGADFNAHIGNEPVWCGWRTHIKAGQQLSLRGGNSGMRAYLAVDGGLDVPVVMGSRSTDLSAQMGGFQGKQLENGDNIPLGPASLAIRRQVGAIQYVNDHRIRALAGSEMSAFTPSAQALFWQSEWTISTSSNRMGARFQGTPLTLQQPLELNSHAVMPGVIQVPPSGLPIALLADAQTTGGYPKVATVIDADLWKLAQTRPGQKVQFVEVSLEEATAARQEWQHYFYQLGISLNAS